MMDTRALDFHDSFEPALLNQFRPDLRPSEAATLSSPLYMGLRRAAGYEPRVIVVPDRDNASVAARASYESRFYVPHGSFLYAITAASDEAEGFSFNVADLGNGGTLFGASLHHSLATGGTGITEGVGNLLHLIQHPRAILHPGLVAAQIINRSGDDNRLQLCLWFMTPEQANEWSPQPNGYNNVLAWEIGQQSRARRGAIVSFDQSGGAQTPDANGARPWETMPANGRPLRYEQIIAAPPAGTDDAVIVSFIVPNGYTCALKRHRHMYTGPGFSEGSGDLIWRIAIDGAHSPGYDDMRTTVGTFGYEDISGALIARSGQRVDYTVSVAAGAVLGDPILAGLQGFFYPQQ